MYAAHDLDATALVRPGSANTLAVKVTPEQSVQDVDGVGWPTAGGLDQLAWNRLPQTGAAGTSFVPDRNAGIWKPVYLRGRAATSRSDLPPSTPVAAARTDSARLTIYADVRNQTDAPVRGVLRATIRRPGKPDVRVEQPLNLKPGESREAGSIRSRSGTGRA